MKLNIRIAFALMTAVCIGIAGMQLVESFVGGSQNPKKHYVSPYVNLQGTFRQADWQSNQNPRLVDHFHGAENAHIAAIASP